MFQWENWFVQFNGRCEVLGSIPDSSIFEISQEYRKGKTAVGRQSAKRFEGFSAERGGFETLRRGSQFLTVPIESA